MSIRTIICNIEDIEKEKKYIDYTDLYKLIEKAGNNYQLITLAVRHYFLYIYQYNKNHEIKLDFPILNHDFLCIFTKAFSKSSCGPKPKGTNLTTFQQISNYFEIFMTLLPTYNDEQIKECKLNLKKFKSNTKEYKIWLEKYNSYVDNYKLDSSNLSYIYQSMFKELETSIKNNVILNFGKYVHQYVNSFFLKYEHYLSKEELNILSDNDKIKFYENRNNERNFNKEKLKELEKVKSDIMENTKKDIPKSDEKYHKFIKKTLDILPKLSKDELSHADYFTISPNEYIIPMIIMNERLEKEKYKMFQFMPIRTETVGRKIPFNTPAIKDVFRKQFPRKKLDDMNDNEIWETFFCINKKYCNRVFNNMISTDGKSVSISFITDDGLDKKIIKNNIMDKARREAKTLYKDKTQEEIQLIKNDKEENKKKLSELKKIEKKEIKQKQKEDFKKLPIIEQERIKLEIKNKKNNGILYIEDAIKNETLREELQKQFERNNIITGDPGMKSICTFLGKGNKTKTKKGIPEKDINGNNTGNIEYCYRNRRRLEETRRLKYGISNENRKQKMIYNNKSIKERESELTEFSHKSIDLQIYEKYIKMKLKLLYDINNNKFIYTDIELQKTRKRKSKRKIKRVRIKKKLIKEYTIQRKIIKNTIDLDEILDEDKKKPTEPNKKISYNDYLKKIRFFAHINKERHEAHIINEIKEIYGSNKTIIIGDQSRNGKIRYISTPNCRMIKLLKRHFKIYFIDEFRTSKLSWLTDEPCENLKMTNLKGIKRSIHSVLTFKMSNSNVCVNRDTNAVRNMFKIVKSLIYNKNRPYNFCRSTKIENIKPIKVKLLTNTNITDNINSSIFSW